MGPSRTVPHLEQRGLVRREPVSSDQRRTGVSLILFTRVAAGSEPLYAGIAAQSGERAIADVLRPLDTPILRLGPDR